MSSVQKINPAFDFSGLFESVETFRDVHEAFLKAYENILKQSAEIKGKVKKSSAKISAFNALSKEISSALESLPEGDQKFDELSGFLNQQGGLKAVFLVNSSSLVSAVLNSFKTLHADEKTLENYEYLASILRDADLLCNNNALVTYNQVRVELS